MAHRDLLVPIDELRLFQETTGAFGDPDGHRASLDHFVWLSAQEANGGLRLTDGDSATRVIVGRKGSGKTLYLRMLQDAAVRDSSVYAQPVEPLGTLPGTRHVAAVGEWFSASEDALNTTAERAEAAAQVASVGDWFPEDLLTEIWMLIWNRAVTSSLSSRLIHDDALHSFIRGDERAELTDLLGSLRVGLRLKSRSRSPFTFVRHFVDVTNELSDSNPHMAGRALRRMLDDPVWDDIASLINDALQDAPPIFVYIDAIDEEFAHKPMRWLRCQKGLFYTVMRMMRSDHPVAGRIHVVIAVRDIVLSSVMNSEHATRYRSSPHIRSLSWDSMSIRAFLKKKIEDLGPEYRFPDSPTSSSLEGWIGLDQITTSNGHTEPVETYALRHTQVLPRDVVLLGNNLSDAVDYARRRGRAALETEEFRAVVERVGAACGLTQVVATANQAIAEGLDESSTPLDFERSQVSADEYQSPGTEQLLEIISTAGSLRFEGSMLAGIREQGRSTFGCSDLPSILWQAGLLAYTEAEHDVFHRSDYQSHFAMPPGKAMYTFHPTMRECAGLNASGRLVDVI